MSKGKIVLGVVAAVIGSGLLWAAGGREDSGIAGWETLNVSMEEAVGSTAKTETGEVVQEVKGEQVVSATVEKKDTAVIEQKIVEEIEPIPEVAVQEGKINVNTADAKGLMELPGIGEKKAQDIIDYRSREGAFRNLTDLGKVKGIGPKMLEKLKLLVIF